MSDTIISLNVPALPQFARSVRMMAANLAVLTSMNVDEVEDARMAAEEAFVYACATRPEVCEMRFEVGPSSLQMSFSLGTVIPEEEEEVAEQVSLAQLLLSCVCDSFEVSEDRAFLYVTKLGGDVDAAE